MLKTGPAATALELAGMPRALQDKYREAEQLSVREKFEGELRHAEQQRLNNLREELGLDKQNSQSECGLAAEVRECSLLWLRHSPEAVHAR